MSQRTVSSVRVSVPGPGKEIDPCIPQLVSQQVKKVAEVALSSMDKKIDKEGSLLATKKIEEKKIFSFYAPLLLSVGALVVLAGFFQYGNKEGWALRSDDSPPSSGQDTSGFAEPTSGGTPNPSPESRSSPEIKPSMVSSKLTVTAEECQVLCQSLREDFEQSQDLETFSDHAEKVHACERLLEDQFCPN